ncbi:MULTISPECIES: MBL fold metallo-hydrolase [unclassified Kitasatospora]|uniref:ComEC/Rec2 family competence protein n=1 Tax=unclassified Kitasatospora TaxID=2633591 RepID=UPI00340960EF
MITIEMLPAAHGDALWVEWPGSGTAVHRMLVDGGPSPVYPAVFARVKALPARSRHLDVLVVTHVDGDHIEGVVRLLQDRAALNLAIDDVWFNGWPQVSERADLLGAAQGEMVQALIDRQKLSWNAAFGLPRAGKAPPALCLADRGALPTAELPGGARATLLSPGRPELDALLREWGRTVRSLGMTPGDPDQALALLAQRKNLRGLATDLLGGERLDTSVPNGSSIAFLLEHDGHRLLLTGDSHGDVLGRGLDRLLKQLGGTRLTVGALKVPHHGSAANTTDGLLSRLDTRRFLVSTNGDKFHHPDAAAIDRMIAAVDHLDAADGSTEDGGAAPAELVFNYRSRTTEPWADAAQQRERHYTAVYPAAPATGTTVEV